MTEQSYYNENGKYQSEYNRLWKLVPKVDQAYTVAGELMRAINYITYEHYNNGHCNNCTGALNFLHQHNAISDDTFVEMYPHANLSVYYNGGSDLDEATMIKATDEVLEAIAANPELESTYNDLDIQEMDDPDAKCHDDEEDDDYGDE